MSTSNMEVVKMSTGNMEVVEKISTGNMEMVKNEQGQHGGGDK